MPGTERQTGYQAQLLKDRPIWDWKGTVRLVRKMEAYDQR